MGSFLAIDQGTTSTRAIAFDRGLRPVASASRPLVHEHPLPGWAETDPVALLNGVVDAAAEVIDSVGGPDEILAAGLDNPGETVVAWDAHTLEPLEPAILWQCRRSLPLVERLKANGDEPAIRARTGLPLDPYYSAGKFAWLLQESEPVRAAARAGRLRLGTVDAWLTAHLGDAGPAGRTDHSTASRTQLLDLEMLDWHDALLATFGVDRSLLPTLGPTVGRLGTIGHRRWGGRIALTAMACDQQAALAGHGAFAPGAMKVTYGTGAFVLANAGSSCAVVDGLETSVGWTHENGQVAYVLQGGVLSVGALLDWLRDGIGLIADATGTADLATSVPDTAGVHVLPALSGLGAPWFRPSARAVVAGLGAGVTHGHIVRAALDGICHRVCDIVEVMLPHLGSRDVEVRVDGGVTANDYLLHRQADLLGLPIETVATEETTGLGIAALAGIGAGVLPEESVRAANPSRRRYQPTLSANARLAERSAWQRFVEAAAAL